MSAHDLACNTVVVGGGQAGLSMSYHLAQRGIEHMVLERARIGERWRSERWDSLRFQFPNRYLRLPGMDYDGDAPESFMHAQGVVDVIERYANRISAPVRCGVNVEAIERNEDGDYLIEATTLRVRARNVVLATGPYQRTRIPAASAQLPAHIRQLPASGFTNASALPVGGVLVVGSGGSGVQIAEDLIAAGRDTWLCVGPHRRAPRRYRGRDLMDWFEQSASTAAPTPEGRPHEQAPLLLTGADGGYDVDLRRLAANGGHLVGRLEGVLDGDLFFGDQLHADIAAGDRSYDDIVQRFDAMAAKYGDAGLLPPEPPREWTPIQDAPIRSLKVERSGIAAVIWATGYAVDFSWVHCGDCHDDGRPVQHRGVGTLPGLYYLGLSFMHTARSSFFWGVGDDAAYIAQHIAGEQRPRR